MVGLEQTSVHARTRSLCSEMSSLIILFTCEPLQIQFRQRVSARRAAGLLRLRELGMDPFLNARLANFVRALQSHAIVVAISCPKLRLLRKTQIFLN